MENALEAGPGGARRIRASALTLCTQERADRELKNLRKLAECGLGVDQGFVELVADVGEAGYMLRPMGAMPLAHIFTSPLFPLCLCADEDLKKFVRNVGEQLITIFHALHRAGLAWVDVSVSNIIVLISDDGGVRVKLIDAESVLARDTKIDDKTYVASSFTPPQSPPNTPEKSSPPDTPEKKTEDTPAKTAGSSKYATPPGSPAPAARRGCATAESVGVIAVSAAQRCCLQKRFRPIAIGVAVATVARRC